MTPNTWLEAVISPPLSWAGGQALEPFSPFEVSGPLRLGPRGSGSEVEWSSTHSLQLTPGPGGVLFADGRELKTAKPSLLQPGRVWWRPPLMLRALATKHDSGGWPPGLARPRAPWSDETLAVLADQLLEWGLTVGQRLITRDERADSTWLPAFVGLGPSDAVITWRKGVLDTLSINAPEAWAFGRALALQAVCVPLRRLVIKCAPRIVPSGLVVGLMVGGGLPCLEALRLEVNQRCSAVELAAMPGFVAAFPALTSFEVERQLPWARHPLPVVR